MKRLITLLFILISIFSIGQDTKPTNPEFTKLQTPNNPIFWYNPIDSAVWVFKGTLGWTRIQGSSDAAYRYVPYKGATKNVDLDTMAIRTGYIDLVQKENPYYGAYRLFADTTAHTLAFYNDESDITLQIGQEMWARVKNNLGGTVLNGTVVRIIGSENGIPTVDLASNNNHITSDGVLGVMTHDVESGTFGFTTTMGEVHGLTTSDCPEGSIIYLGLNGAFTHIRPLSPNFVIEIGTCLYSHATDGTIMVNIKGSPYDIVHNSFNDIFLESMKFTVTSNGTTITGSLERNGGGNLTMQFSDGFTTLDCTPAKTITLTAGSTTVPQTNYVYALKSTKDIATSTSGWPSEEHIKISQVACRAAALTQSDGILRNQNWNDHISGANGSGHISHINERIRRINADWYSGVEPSVTIVSASDPDNVYFHSTGGKVYQMHLQDFPAQSMPTADIHVVNHFTTPYTTTTNLNTQLTDALNATLANRSFSFVIWGIQNESGETSHLMLNLPIGSYSSGELAKLDASNYSVYSIPEQFKGVGFLIARVTFSHSPSGSGTWTLNQVQDLRGYIPNNTAGGGAQGSGGITSYLGLTDTPSSYAGAANKLQGVNSGETALEHKGVTATLAGTLNIPTGQQYQINSGNIIQDQIRDAVIVSAPTENAVFDALAGKEPANANIQAHIANDADLSITNEGLLTTVHTTNNSTIQSNTSGSNILNLKGAGINVVSGVGNTITITGTEVDGSISNEGSLSVGVGSTTSSIINSNTSGSTGVTLNASTGLSISETASSITLTNTAPNITTNLSVSGTSSPLTLNSSDGTDVTVTAGTGISLTGTASNITITNSSPNADQTITLSGDVTGTGTTAITTTVVDDSHSHTTATLPNIVSSIDGVVNDGGDIDLIQAGIVTITPNDINNNITISATEVDGLITNEGQLSVGAGAANTSTINSNTSGSGIVTISGTTKQSVTESGNTITVDVIEAGLTLSNLSGSVTDSQVPNTITLDNITQITNRSHTNLSDIGTNSHATIDNFISSKAQPNGLASLDSNGKLPSGQLPSLAISETFVVANEGDKVLQTAAERGDVVIVTSTNKSYILQQDPYSVEVNWILIRTPDSPVQSVNGQTGNVSLTTSDISEGTNLYYTNTRSRAAISETVTGLDYNNTTGVLSTTSGYGIPTTTQIGNIHTLDADKQTISGTGSALSGYQISLDRSGGTVTLPNEADGLVTNEGQLSTVGTVNNATIQSNTSGSNILNIKGAGTTVASASGNNITLTSNDQYIGTVISVIAGDGMTQTGTSTINPTLNVVSHNGTAGSIGTVNVSADAIGVNLGSTSTTAMRGDNGTAAYNDKINSLAFSGTSTKTLTLTQQDAGTVTGTFTDIDTDQQNLSLGTRTGTQQPINITNGTGVTIDVADNDNSSSNEFQNLSDSKTGNNVTVNISNGTGTTFSVADGDSLTTNEIQDLSLSGNTLSLSGDATSVDLSAYVNPDISGKIDKVSLTDNAVVRADGENGAVQNSGVIIDDSNNITTAGIYKSIESTTNTAPKLILENSGTGDASLALSLGGGLGWSIGVDNSSSDILRFAPQTYGVDSNSKFDLTTLGAATFASTIQATTAKLTNLTDGYLPYHISDASGLGNSELYTDGTNFGIGTTTLNARITLLSTGIGAYPNNYSTSKPTISIRQKSNPSYGWDITDEDFSNGNLYVDRIVNNVVFNVLNFSRATGNILINTTTDDLTNKLQVNGSIKATTATFTTVGTTTGTSLLGRDTGGLLTTNVSSSNLSDGSNLAKLNAANVFSGWALDGFVTTISETNTKYSQLIRLTNPGQRISIGYLSALDVGYIQAVSSLNAARQLSINPFGGIVAFGSSISATTATFTSHTGTGTRLSTLSSTGGVGAIANGSEGHVMKIVSGVPTWAAALEGKNISATFDPTTRIFSIIDDYGTVSDTIPIATEERDGLFAKEDKEKLDGITIGAEQNVNADWNATSGDAFILNKPAIMNLSVQSLSGTTPTLNVTNGVNARITLSGNTTITFSNLVAGYTGNITATNASTPYTISFAGYTIKIAQSVWSTGDTALTSGNSEVDSYSWYYDGDTVFINGTLTYK